PWTTMTGVVTTVPSKLCPDAQRSSARVPGSTDWPSRDSGVVSAPSARTGTGVTAAASITGATTADGVFAIFGFFAGVSGVDAWSDEAVGAVGNAAAGACSTGKS